MPNLKSLKQTRLYSKYGSILPLILISLIAGAIYISGIGLKGLWFDEVLSFTQATGNGVVDIPEGKILSAQQVRSLFEIDNNTSITDVLQGLAKHDNHPPLYFIGLFLFLKAFGTTPEMAQLFSVIIAILCIAAIYFLSTDITDKEVAIWVSGLFAFSPYITYYAQEVRPYILLIFFSLLSSLFLFKAITLKNKFKWLLIWGVISSFGFLTLAIYALIFASQIIIIGWFYIKKLLPLTTLKIGLLFLSIAIPIIPWYVYRYQFQSNFQAVNQFRVDKLSVKLLFSSAVTNFPSSVLAPGNVPRLLEYIIFLGFLLLFATCLTTIWRSRRELFLPLLILSILPITGAYLFDILLKTNTVSRMRIWSVSMPFMIIVVGIGLSYFKLKKWRPILASVIFSIAISSSLLISQGNALPKSNAKQVIQWLNTQSLGERPLILTQQDENMSRGAWGAFVLHSQTNFAVLPLSLNTLPKLENIKTLVDFTDVIVLYERKTNKLNQKIDRLLKKQNFEYVTQSIASENSTKHTYGRVTSAFHYKNLSLNMDSREMVQR
jgi:uncharacterized membrane protein